ncbi:cytochrome p450 domain-containing protein [Trichoderma breve]|uniref:Cytochrome p450 domain-containing protein n=1 Tax=Trichoderma breve TaxID=2034170 RepID=A0A9W9E869_9HYPO|nr:cytochrome p450 domain-containing protein [Trichoderma breve]KAJ4861649.1 cytochrome p450 domain-containing protein [Trichoderma breve]
MSVITDTVLSFKLAALVIYKEKLLGVTFLVAALLVAQFHRVRTATSFLVRRIHGVLYLFSGPELIDRAYNRAQGKPFKVSTPSNDYLFITSTSLIKELINAPSQHLSLHAVAKEILQPNYTMCGFEVQDHRGIEGTGYVRALRSLLTSHLPKFQPHLEGIVKNALLTGLRDVQSDGIEANWFAHAKIFPLMKTLVTRVNCFIFFGEELSQNTEFTSAALDFPQDVAFAAEFLRITPEFMRPLVASIATNRHKAATTLYRYLVPIIEQRLAIRGLQSNEATPMDCMQWLIDNSPRKNPWTPAKMVGEIMAVWFGSVHQLAMTSTYAIQDLCLHPEYVEPLAIEIRDCFHAEDSPRDVERLPLLDSFIKESVRNSNFDAITCRRKALVPYIFQDGSSLNKGDWACIPQRAMMQDSTRYRDPQTFDGFRFAHDNAQLHHQKQPINMSDRKESKFTDATLDWPIWGLGNAVCPGRFYASLVTKLILIRILEDWECKILEPEAPRSMTWRSSIVPRSSTIIMFRKKHL